MLGALIGVCVSAVPLGAAAQPAAAHPYRLNLQDASVYRLPADDLASPDPVRTFTQGRRGVLATLPYFEQVEIAAMHASLDPALVHAVIHVESRHNPAARSPKGALGLMQVMPDTAARYGIADVIRSVEVNLRAGTSYLRDLMRIFDGRLELALAAYNAGENAVLRHGLRIPPYRETRMYVPAVLEKYREWRETTPVPDPVPLRSNDYIPGTRIDSSVRTDVYRAN